jgi:antirestriction protein ArdC
MKGITVYERVTEQIIERLKAGVVPWRKPWDPRTGQPKNLHTGKPYRGMNVWLLGDGEYPSPYWITYRQANERGGQVRRGEKGRLVVFWQLDRVTKDADGETTVEKRAAPVLKYYTVFNALQCDGLEIPAPRPFVPIAPAEEIAAGMPSPPTLLHRGGTACYSPALDTVWMPPREAFAAAERYYSTLYHELAHATGHASRLNRPGSRTSSRSARRNTAGRSSSPK